MAERGNRDHLVISTKFSSNYKRRELDLSKTANFSGNHRRSIPLSVLDSLKKLQAEYLDIIYMHWWDYTTSIEEVMDTLHFLVEQGKVLYLGVSDTPAWVVGIANSYARHHGKTPFSVYQGRWNIMDRDFERDIIPMARHFGMALAPWGVLGSGKFQTKKDIETREAAGDSLRAAGGKQTGDQARMSAALSKVAGEHGIQSVTAIALAYIIQKSASLGVSRVFPVIGGRKVEQLRDNIRALSIVLTETQISYLESVHPFDIGFPGNFIGEDPNTTGSSNMLAGTGYLAFPDAKRLG